MGAPPDGTGNQRGTHDILLWIRITPTIPLKLADTLDRASRRALATILGDTLSGAPIEQIAAIEQVAAIEDDLVYRIFSRELSMGKSMGLTSMVAMVRRFAEQALRAPEDSPAELADELAAMHMMSDDALLATVYPSMSRAEQERLAQVSTDAGERP